jgi:hypothetical protein
MGRNWSWLGSDMVWWRISVISIVLIVSYIVWKYYLKDDE